MPQTLKTVNLEDGHPTVNEGILRLERAIVSAKAERFRVVKLIHGYGSSGQGGALRIEAGKVLERFKRSGMVEDFIPGEDFRISDERTWALVRRLPEFKADRDLGRMNKGITIVIL